MSTEVKFIEVFEPMTDLEDKLTRILNLYSVNNEVRFTEAFEPVTDLEYKFIYLPPYYKHR
jgi:hypothetical protein